MTMLTAERIRELFDYNPEDGTFTRRVTLTHNAKQGAVIRGCKTRNGYLIISVDDKRQYAHRLAWMFMTGELPASGSDIDHINLDRTDNRWSNLRLASRSQNMRNSSATWSRSGVRGVSHTKSGAWRAHITCNSKYISLGEFASIETAAAARAEAERRLFGEFGRA